MREGVRAGFAECGVRWWTPSSDSVPCLADENVPVLPLAPPPRLLPTKTKLSYLQSEFSGTAVWGGKVTLSADCKRVFSRGFSDPADQLLAPLLRVASF